MTDVREAAQQIAQQSVIEDSIQAESATSGPSGANDSGLTQQGSEHERGVAQLGFAVQLTVQGLRNGAGPTLMPLLVRLLPFLLKTQVCFFYCTILLAAALSVNTSVEHAMKHEPAV